MVFNSWAQAIRQPQPLKVLGLQAGVTKPGLTYIFWLPQNITTNTLLLTRSLSGNINNQLTHILYVLCIYTILLWLIKLEKKIYENNKKEKIYLLFIKWKWTIIKVFILTVFTLSRLNRLLKRRGRAGLAVSGVSETEENAHINGPMQLNLCCSRASRILT